MQETIIDHPFEGYQYQTPETSIDTSKIINKILAYRTEVADPDVVEYVASYDDLDSQAKYGLFEEKIIFADFIDTPTIAKMCGYLLLLRANPQVKAEVQNYPLSLLSAPFAFGNYAISNRRDNYWKIIADCDDLVLWDDAAFINSTLELDDTHVLTGRQALKFTTAAGSDGEYVEFEIANPIALPQKVRMFIYFDIVAPDLRITFEDDDNNTMVFEFDSITDQWFKLTEDSVQLTQVQDFAVTKVQNPSIINEGFEGVGYEEVWVETEDAGSTLDPDAAPPDDFLEGADLNCLEAQMTGVDTDCYITQDLSNNDPNWFGCDFRPEIERFANGEECFIMLVRDSGDDHVCGIYWGQNAGVQELWFGYYENGAWSQTAHVTITIMESIRVEMKYDLDDDTWAWRIDKVEQNSGPLAAATRTPKIFSLGIFSHSAGNGPVTAYFDQVYWDDVYWQGPELFEVDKAGFPDEQFQVRNEIEQGLNLIAKVTITMLTNAATTFYVDRLDTLADVYSRHVLQLEEVEYNLASRRLTADMNFGDKKDSVIDEIKGKVEEGNLALGIFSKQ